MRILIISAMLGIQVVLVLAARGRYAWRIDMTRYMFALLGSFWIGVAVGALA